MEQESLPIFNGDYGDVDLTQDGLNTKARMGSMYSCIAVATVAKSPRRRARQYQYQPTIIQAIESAGTGFAEST